MYDLRGGGGGVFGDGVCVCACIVYRCRCDCEPVYKSIMYNFIVIICCIFLTLKKPLLMTLTLTMYGCLILPFWL